MKIMKYFVIKLMIVLSVKTCCGHLFIESNEDSGNQLGLIAENTNEFGYHLEPTFLTRVYNFPRLNYRSTKLVLNPKRIERSNPIFYKMQSSNYNDPNSLGLIVGLNNILLAFFTSTDNAEEYLEISNY